MKFDVLVEKIRDAFEALFTLLKSFFAQFDVRPNYEKTDIWTDKYPNEADETE